MPTTTQTLPLAEALQSQKSFISERFTSQVHRAFEKLVEQFGPTLKGASNSFVWSASYTFCRPFLQQVDPKARGTNEAKQVNTARLAVVAEQYATETVAGWADKLAGKLKGSTDVQVLAFLGGYISLTATAPNGGALYLEQHMIVNVSPKGKVFNQFPARLTLDGKAVSERAFAKILAGA